jgi:hypothetical protein
VVGASPERAAAATPFPGAWLRRNAVALTLALAACNAGVEGNGVFREETRDESGFEGIAVDDGMTAIVTAGEGSYRVSVSGDENVVQWIQTSVVTDPSGIRVLSVSVGDRDYTSKHPLRAVVSLPALTLIRARGASSVEASGVAGAEIEIEASDGSAVRPAGPGAAFLRTKLFGEKLGGRLLAAGLPVVTARVELEGDSRAELYATGAVFGVAVPPSVVVNGAVGATCDVTDGAVPTPNPVACGP